MKMKLYKMWIKKILSTHEFDNYIETEPSLKTARVHELARRYWHFELKGRAPAKHVRDLMQYASFLKDRYKRRSRKYWTAESRLKRAIVEGDDRK